MVFYVIRPPTKNNRHIGGMVFYVIRPPTIVEYYLTMSEVEKEESY